MFQDEKQFGFISISQFKREASLDSDYNLIPSAIINAGLLISNSLSDIASSIALLSKSINEKNNSK